MFSPGQVAAVRASFALAGFDGPIVTMPVESEDERVFLVPPDSGATMGDPLLLEQVLSQLLSRKVMVTEDIRGPSVPFV